MELLPHQNEAVDKFANVKACLIGDSMGVGKTVTGIGRDLRLRQDHGKPGSHIRTLIVCQKSGLSVWDSHLRAFGIPDNRILVVDPGDRKPFEKELSKGAGRYDYYVVHWNVLTKLEDLTAPPKIQWHHVIADEVHLAKNRAAARTKELKKLNASVKTGLSGTPADNKPEDLWSILNWLYPQKYRSYWKFYDNYVEYETGYTGYRIATGVKNLDKLHEELSPIYIRRTLYDVRKDMPPKNHSTILVDLTDKQRRDYDRMAEYQVVSLGYDDREMIAPVAVAAITRFQQLTAGTCKIDWTAEQWDAYDELLYKYEEEYFEWEQNGEQGPEPKRPDSPKITIQEPSPKLDALFDLIDDNPDESFVVWTNYPQVADLVRERCIRKSIPCVRYVGSTSQTERDAAVADFQSKKARVFAGTIAAAGTGITLNAAHTAVFLDRHWNPSLNVQAEDRIYRINNDDLPVQIIDIQAKDTFDVEKWDKIGTKAKWLKDFLTPRG